MSIIATLQVPQEMPGKKKKTAIIKIK